MAFSGSSMAGTLEGILSGLGMSGPDLTKFCTVIGMGSQDTLVGAPFATLDVGSITGEGAGAGTALIGFVPGVISAAIVVAAIAAFGGSGPDLPVLALAIEQALISEAANASLTSTHKPTFVGSGSIVLGSIVVSGSAWGSAIKVRGLALGMVGPDWAGMADAIGTGCAGGFTTVTGSVTITEVSHVDPPATGGGSGAGVIG